MLIFNARNIVRVNKEIKQYNSDSFPFFYVPKVDYKTIYINKDTNIYIPINEACWAIKTPCAGGSEDLRLIKILGYKVFLSKSKK